MAKGGDGDQVGRRARIDHDRVGASVIGGEGVFETLDVFRHGVLAAGDDALDRLDFLVTPGIGHERKEHGFFFSLAVAWVERVILGSRLIQIQ